MEENFMMERKNVQEKGNPRHYPDGLMMSRIHFNIIQIQSFNYLGAAEQTRQSHSLPCFMYVDHDLVENQRKENIHLRNEPDKRNLQLASIGKTKLKFFTLGGDLNFGENGSAYLVMWSITLSSNFCALLSCIMREYQKRETYV